MQLGYAIIAKYAELAPNGIFSVLSGGVDAWYCEEFPTEIPHLSLVVKILLEEADLDVLHHPHVKVMRQDIDLLTENETPKIPFSLLHKKPLPKRLVSTSLLTYRNLPISGEGPIDFQLYIDDKLFGVVPL